MPLLDPVVAELAYELPPRGFVLTRHGEAFQPKQLSIYSHNYLRSIEMPTNLHSPRHAFATGAYRSNGDLLLVERLLGHENVSTIQLYAEPYGDAHTRLAGRASGTVTSVLHCAVT